MEECAMLAERGEKVDKEEVEEWWTRHSQSKKKEKGDVGVGNEKKKEKEEEEKMESFFCKVHELLTDLNVTNFLSNSRSDNLSSSLSLPLPLPSSYLCRCHYLRSCPYLCYPLS